MVSLCPLRASSLVDSSTWIGSFLSLFGEFCEAFSLLVASVENGGVDRDGTSFNLLFLAVPLLDFSSVYCASYFCLWSVGSSWFYCKCQLVENDGFQIDLYQLCYVHSQRCQGIFEWSNLLLYRIFHSLRLMLVNPSLLITFAYTAFQIIFTWIFARQEGIFQNKLPYSVGEEMVLQPLLLVFIKPFAEKYLV